MVEMSPFDPPMQAWQFPPDKDVEGGTRMDVEYPTLRLSQMCGSVTVPSDTGKIFGSRFYRDLGLQEQNTPS